MTISQPISQSEINAILWKACDTFRGTVDPSEYKNYILVMLFVKYISDVWQEKLTEYHTLYSGDAERIQRRLSREKFRIPATATFGALYAQRNADNLGEVINMALEAIEEANREKLQGVFRNIDFNSEAALGRPKERNARLKNLLDDFNDPRLDMRPSRIGNQDVIGDAYEYLIGRFAAGAGKKAGEFYTPPEVSTLLAKLVDPQPGDRICDWACGSASLLIKCAKEVGGQNFALYGQESNGSTWALAMMNMFLHDVSGADIKWGDTLGSPLLLEGDHLKTFEVNVANPPFSLDKWGAEDAANDRFKRFWRGIPPKSKGDYAFISHMIETMDTTRGRMGVIVPHGVLFRGGAEGTIRQKLIEENLLDAVIGLPPNLFYGTGIPAAILLFKRNKPDDTVIFIDASQEFAQGTNQNKLRDQDVQKVVATYTARRDVEKYARVVTRDDLIENDFNANIARYVDNFDEEVEIDLSAVQGEIGEIECKLLSTQQRVAHYLKELGYGS
jgi:type I restriction enzyme M protein